MPDLYVLQLASQSAQWLTQRDSLIASNIANASTPGYRARDLVSFAATLDGAKIGMAITNAAHLTPAAADGVDPASVVEAKASEETLSGNSVNLEQQLMNLGDVSRAYTLNTNIKRALHEMILAVLK